MQSTDRIEQAEPTGREPPRLHYLDWLRVIAILGVWFYHAARPFMLTDSLISNTQRSSVLTLIFLVFLGTFGMPLFFTMAGAGSWLALRRRTGRQFTLERVHRLVIPFVAWSLLLSPFQCYLEWLNKRWYTGSFLGFIPLLVEDRLHSLLTRFSPSIFQAVGCHLWFLAYLFSFSLIALPLFLWLRGRGGNRILGWLGKLGDRRGGLLAFVLPIAGVRLLLQPFYPGYTDWTDFGYMLAYFVCGYVVYADERLLRAVRRDGRLAMTVGILSTAVMVVGLAVFGGAQWVMDPRTPGFYLGWTLVAINGWCWTLFALSLGMRCLNFRSRLLDYGQAMIVPFYVLHQPPVIAIAFCVVQWNAGIAVKLPVVVLASFAATIALCALVRAVRPAHALFGIKPSRGLAHGKVRTA
jgi:peptidoglycan/LPS O-acetylase OafA/YrhL